MIILLYKEHVKILIKYVAAKEKKSKIKLIAKIIVS
jgi:hypothetical protein